MMRKTSIFPIVSFALMLAPAAFAADPPVFYISMRALTSEAVASFVVVERQATAARTAAIAGCDELTYYATPADAAAVATARSAGELVQLHRAEAGQAPQASAVMCILDAAGGA